MTWELHWKQDARILRWAGVAGFVAYQVWAVVRAVH